MQLNKHEYMYWFSKNKEEEVKCWLKQPSLSSASNR